MKQLSILFICITIASQLLGQNDGNITKRKGYIPEEQIIQPSIILGFNTTQVEGDQLSGFRKFGANAGAGAFIRLPKSFAVKFEILYSQKGSKSSATEAASRLSGPYKLILDYIDVPVTVNYIDKDRAIFGVGIVLSNLIRNKETLGGVELNSDFRRFGADVLVDITFLIKRRYGLNFRYTYGVMNFMNTADLMSPLRNGTPHHNVLTMRFMYIFR